MQATYIVFPEKGQVAVREEVVLPPGPGEVLCAARKSLISIGTETYCLRGVFDADTNWARWVQFPFRPGYSMAAQVIAVGEGVTTLQEGDRVTGWIVHRSHFKAQAESLQRIPDGVSDEEATWAALGTTTQLGVRRAAHVLGERVGVVGMGILGQLVVQYLALSGARQISPSTRCRVAWRWPKHMAQPTELALDVHTAGQQLMKLRAARGWM
ncbi:MAG: hypothetical protein R3E79_62165 [Caldilineaceae bacterium]